MLIAIVLGIIAGTITGVIPGIHINLVSAVLLSVSFKFENIPIFIIAMAVTHTFIDVIPSIYLGAPEDDTALAVLPGHQLLMCGMGHEAIRLTVIGSLFCLIICVFLFPLFLFAFPLIYNVIKNYVGWILLIIAVFMILKEKNMNKTFWSLAVFMFSGILGMIVLSLEMKQPLFPLLSGLFGVSMLVYSIFKNTKLPKQAITEMIKVKNSDTAKALTAGILSGSLTAMLPGVGAAHAAVLASTIFKSITNFTYLILIGGVNTVNFVLSLATLYTLNKARNGAVVAVMEIMPELMLKDILVFISVALIAGGIATIICLKLSKIFCKGITRINYKLLCISVIFLITILVFIFSGFIGLLILIISTAIGLIPVLTDVNRSSSMGCLLLPVILYFLA